LQKKSDQSEWQWELSTFDYIQACFEAAPSWKLSEPATPLCERLPRTKQRPPNGTGDVSMTFWLFLKTGGTSFLLASNDQGLP
jgi:hypothetical protein